MKRISWHAAFLASIFLFVPTQNAHAQTSVYGAVALTNFGFDNNGNFAAKSDTGGFVAGGFYNFPIDSRLTAGLDARVSDGFGARGGTTAALTFRIGFVPTRVRLRPYFQIGGGFVTSSVAIGQITGPVTQGLTTQPTRFTNGAGEFAGGLDIRLSDSFDLRAFDIGAAADGSNSKTTVSSAFFDAGVVYHFHKHP